MQILSATGGIASTNSYVVADEIAGKAVLFDAPDHTVGPLLDEIERRRWDLIGLWLTHGHFDHLADHKVATDRFPGAKLLIHPSDEEKLRRPLSRFFSLPFDIPARGPDGLLSDNQELAIGSIAVRVLYTPGHSPGHVMFHLPDHRMLIGGDLIIMGAVGRTDLPDSSFPDLQASIRRVMKLPPATTLLPGHGPSSTLADEASNNPYVIEADEGT